MWNARKTILVILLIGLAGSAPALSQGSNVTINGQQLSWEQLQLLQQQIGSYIVPGHYLYDAASGCWYNQSNATSGCLGSGGSYMSRYGSGSYDGSGNWNHWSNAAGGAVGGTSDGCVYTTFGWSNC